MINLLRKHKSIAAIFTIFIAVEIFYFSSISGNVATSEPKLDFVPIAYHFIAFFLLNFFLLYSLKSKRETSLKTIFLISLLSLLYAISDEIHQIFVPLRNSGLFDIAIDSTGILLAALLYFYVEKRN